MSFVEEFADYMVANGFGSYAPDPVPRLYISKKYDGEIPAEGFWIVNGQQGSPLGSSRHDFSVRIERHAQSETAKNEMEALSFHFEDQQCFTFSSNYEIIDLRTSGLFDDRSLDNETFIVVVMNVEMIVRRETPFSRIV